MSRFDEEPDAPLHGECAAEIERLTTELAELRRDAERWRVARRWPFFQSSLVLVWPIWGPGTAYPEAADVVDSRIDWYINTNRIDAAIAAEGEKK